MSPWAASYPTVSIGFIIPNESSKSRNFPSKIESMFKLVPARLLYILTGHYTRKVQPREEYGAEGRVWSMLC